VLIGVPREIKNHEYRVAVSPDGARALVAAGHRVHVQSDAGARVGFADESYRAAGAQIVGEAAAVYAADMVVKVKELQRSEFPLLRPGLIVFCFHHFAADPQLLQAVIDARVTCVAFETVRGADGSLPLLVPMSDIAGRLAPQVGAWALQMVNGGSGVLLSGVAGVTPGRVVIVGGGVVGRAAAQIALGMGADVTMLDRDAARLRALDQHFGQRLQTRLAAPDTLASLLGDADLIVGAVHIPGAHSPKVISREALKAMRPGSVLVDVAIDQGGSAETSRPTSHTRPTYVEEGVVHYCVPNMPSAVARTATLALSRATLAYVLEIANHGLRGALEADAGLAEGLQVHRGEVTHAALARDTAKPYREPMEALR
jgi:alanine dehydrogenase